MRIIFERAVYNFGGSTAYVENSDGSVDGEYMLSIPPETDFHDLSINLENVLAPVPQSFWISSGFLVKPKGKFDVDSEVQYIVWRGGVRLLANPQSGKYAVENFGTARDIADHIRAQKWNEPHSVLIRLFWEPLRVTKQLRQDWRKRDVKS
jgi:hypothetical protein